jgi:hypothetical protein
MKKLNLALSALALAFAGGAQAIPLADLLAGDSITANDKVFDQWRVIFEDPALTVDPTNIQVTALTDGGTDPGPGLRFTVSNGALNIVGDGLYAYIDYMFGFHVQSLGAPIKDNSLSLGESFITASGDNGVYIQELVGTNPASVEDWALADLGIKEVEFSYLDGTGTTENLTDSASFTPQQEIWVSKNILVWASDIDETAGIVAFDQRFSQVPEPSTLLLMGLSIAGMAFRRAR